MMVWHIVLSLCMCIIVAYDVAKYRIPNPMVVLLGVAWPVAALLSPHDIDWIAALLTGLGCLVVGFIFFARNWVGAGDAKLLAVVGLWVSFPGIVDYILYMAVLGGLLSLGLIFARPISANWLWPLFKITRSVPEILQQGKPIPYGVAIAGAFLIQLWLNQIPALPVL